MTTSSKSDDIKKYYKTFDLKNVKDKSNVENQLIYQLYKKPKDVQAPKLEPVEKNHTHQCDLLFLPNDDGYKYCLVVVDIGSRLTDAEPIKDKTANIALKAIKTIYNRKILSQPHILRVDAGSEFKGVFAKYFSDNDVIVSVAQPNRHRQVGLVESRNKSIGTYLHKRMVAEELKTGEQSNEWIEYLPKYIKRINKRLEIKKPTDASKIKEKAHMHTDSVSTRGHAVTEVDSDKEDDLQCVGSDCKLLEVGQKVRVSLDMPKSVITNKSIDSSFREGDPRFEIKPTKIKSIKVSGINPPLYGVEGKTAMYTKGQLLPVDEEKLELPPASVQSKFIIEKILEKKKKKNAIHYLIKWEGYDSKDNTWEKRSSLMKTVPEMVKEFDRR